MSEVRSSSGPLAENSCTGVVSFLTTYFERILDNLRQSVKRHLPCVSNNNPCSSSRTYVYHLGVPPMWDNVDDIKRLLVEMWERLSVLPCQWVQYNLKPISVEINL